MKVGIVCACESELKPYLNKIENKIIQNHAMLDFVCGEIDKVNVVAVACGICKVNAAIATQILIAKFKVDAVINSGTAGAIDESLKIFDTIISTEVAHHDVAEDILTESHPKLSSIYIKCDERLVELVKSLEDKKNEFNLRYGRTVTGECFIADEGRQAIIDKHNPLAVDMETASMAQVCYVNKTPFIAIRTITDTAKHSGLGTFEQNVACASKISRDVVLKLLDELKNTKL